MSDTPEKQGPERRNGDDRYQHVGIHGAASVKKPDNANYRAGWGKWR